VRAPGVSSFPAAIFQEAVGAAKCIGPADQHEIARTAGTRTIAWRITMCTLIRILLTACLKGIAALALGSAILGTVARSCGPRVGVAYIHVSTSEVDLTVDESAYRVESLAETPVVCVLPPGLHVVRMSRSGTMLYEEAFVLEPGQEVVLCAHEGPAGPRVDFPPGSGPATRASLLTAASRPPPP
jgi:hypothetical protein